MGGVPSTHMPTKHDMGEPLSMPQNTKSSQSTDAYRINFYQSITTSQINATTSSQHAPPTSTMAIVIASKPTSCASTKKPSCSRLEQVRQTR